VSPILCWMVLVGEGCGSSCAKHGAVMPIASTLKIHFFMIDSTFRVNLKVVQKENAYSIIAIIFNAATAASVPLFPWMPPLRALLCSMLLSVKTQNMVGAS